MHAPEATIFNYILTVCIILGCIIGFFIISLVRQHRRNIEMYKSKIAAEINTMENERARISADLHDDLGPMLSAIKFKVSSVETDREDAIVLRDAEKNIDDVIQKLRLISNNLLPATLLRKGIAFAIEEFIRDSGIKSQMKISFTYSNIPSLDKEFSVNAYRIIQEVIHNAIKHSGADKMKIDLSVVKDKLQMICSDNGKGYDLDKTQKNNTGLGLRNVWSRTELLKGEVFIESSPGNGTAYTFEFPLNSKI